MAREWTDIWLPADGVRGKLEKAKLFFVPDLDSRMIAANLTIKVLMQYEQNRVPAHLRAGLQVLRNAQQCEPISYRSAIKVIETFNAAAALHAPDVAPLKRSDVVASIFRIKDIHLLIGSAGLSNETFADAAMIPRAIAMAAADRRRVTFVHAERIWKYFLGLKAEGMPLNEVEAAQPGEVAKAWRQVDKENIGACVNADAGYAPSVGRHDLFNAETGETEDLCVYRLEDIEPAPRAGHPWSIELIEAGTAISSVTTG